MKSLNEDLKTGKFKQLYLLYGTEAYLKKQYKDRFIKAMLPEGDTMNYAYYEGKNTDIKEVIDLAEYYITKRPLLLHHGPFATRVAPHLVTRGSVKEKTKVKAKQETV